MKNSKSPLKRTELSPNYLLPGQQKSLELWLQRTEELESFEKALRRLAVLCVLLFALLLTACTETKPSTSDIPAEYFTCMRWPDQPAQDATDLDSGEYIINGHAAWESCDTALARLKGKVAP